MTTDTTDPIAYRNPALVVELCYLAADPTNANDLIAGAQAAGFDQSTATIRKTIDDLHRLGALRRRGPAYTLTPLGRCWLSPDAVTLPALELEQSTDGYTYRWRRDTPLEDEAPPSENNPTPSS